MARVLLVDAQDVIRRGVSKVLEGDAGIRVVGEARSVSEALSRVPAVQPDVVVVAMQLPDGSGAQVCERLRALAPGVRCLVLSGTSGIESVQAAMQAGARGYLGMHVSGRALIAAVRSVAAGEIVLDRSLAAPLSSRADRHSPLEPLTQQELAVLGLIAKGLSNREIGESMGLTPKTVKNYVTRVLSKLGLANRTQAAILATELRAGSRVGETAA